jgi:hypothetical protein
MPANTFRPSFDQSRFDNAQIGGDYYREHAERDLIPRIIERNKQALNVVPDFFHFYQRAYTGRRCSCWGSIETSPSASCLVCYGTGNTAGYQKYGHMTEVLEATSTSASVNVVMDFDEVTRPLQFRLVHQAVRGWMDFSMPVIGGINVCSLASLHAVVPRGSRVRVGVRVFSEADFTPLSTAAVTARLQQAQTTGGLHFRVMLERDSVSAPSPKFSHLRVRYQLLQDDRIRADVPRSEATNRSSEFGWFEDVASRNMWTDNTLRSVTSEDLFRQVNSGRLWKVISANDNAPGGQLTSWDIATRLVQNSERYANLP